MDDTLYLTGTSNNGAQVNKFSSNGTLIWSNVQGDYDTVVSSVSLGQTAGTALWCGGYSASSLQGTTSNQGSFD